MMDDKRLQEIKARAEAAVYDCDYMELESLALHSIPDLIAEVERLRAENTRLRAELEAAKRDIKSMLQLENHEEFCRFCKSVRDEACFLGNCLNADWRGLCAENGGGT